MARIHWRWMAATALGSLAIAIASWFASRVVPNCGAELAAPMLQFELALDRAEFARVIDCLPRRGELDRQNLVDLWLFIPAYSAFLATFAWAAGVRRVFAIALGVGIALSDFVETIILRAVSSTWPQSETSLIPLLAVGTRLKFTLIAVALLVTAIALWRRRGVPKRLVAAVMAAGSIGSLSSMVPGIGRTGSAMIAVSWLVMLVHSAAQLLLKQEIAPTNERPAYPSIIVSGG